MGRMAGDGLRCESIRRTTRPAVCRQRSWPLLVGWAANQCAPLQVWPSPGGTLLTSGRGPSRHCSRISRRTGAVGNRDGARCGSLLPYGTYTLQSVHGEQRDVASSPFLLSSRKWRVARLAECMIIGLRPAERDSLAAGKSCGTWLAEQGIDPASAGWQWPHCQRSQTCL